MTVGIWRSIYCMLLVVLMCYIFVVRMKVNKVNKTYILKAEALNVFRGVRSGGG